MKLLPPTLTLILVLGVFTGVAVLAEDEDARTPNPTTIGEAIIGFDADHMPDVKVGERFLGYPVVQVVEPGRFIVVSALDLAPLEIDTEGIDGIRYVEDNGLLHTFLVPNDTRYGEQWGPEPMGFETAWDTTLGDSDVIVSVLDTGIRKTHNDFDDALIMQGWDYVNDDNNPNDDCGHGTHVTGTVGAWTNNNAGVAGMAQVRLMHMKVLSPLINPLITCSGSNSDIADAIYDSADQGADVISMSLGGASGSTVLKNAVDYAWNNGVLVVAAAGNDNGGPVNYPAAYDSVIAVSALDSDLTIASYSSVGPQVEVAAPGTGVLSTYYSNDNSYSSLSGTSMATPHVAGALALALSAHPGTPGTTMRTALQTSAQDLGAAGRDNTYGYGLARVDLLIDELGPANNPPTAAFTHSEDGLTVSVDAAGSTDPDGDTLTYSWDFGDGGQGSGVTASHTYAGGGTYTVTLTVNDGRGGTDIDAQTVTVTGPPPPPNDPPTAAFTFTTSDLTVDVDGSGSSDPNGDTLAYSWDFGDGDTGSGATASHTYAAAGTYTVTLTVTDGRGGSDSAAQEVTVTAPADPDPSTPNLESGVAISVTVNAQNPDHHYKIQVPAGATNLRVFIDGPNCGLLSCPVDADLYTRSGQRATDSAYDCRPYEGDSDEECDHASPQDGWWYIRVKRFSGSGTVTLKATIS